MKKIFTLILAIVLLYSCSTSNDGNGNSTTNVVPFAPTGLHGAPVQPPSMVVSHPFPSLLQPSNLHFLELQLVIINAIKNT